MKIKVKTKNYNEVLKINKYSHKNPKKQSKFLSFVIRQLIKKDLKSVNFSYELLNMDNIKDDDSTMILMNHSSFIDLEIIFEIFKKKSFNIVATDDSFVGLEPILRLLGCIPTKKFLNDITLVNDILFAIRKLKSSVLMFPEASYSFDGTMTPLPISIGKMVKLAKVPLIIVKTEGAFLRDPLYNNLQIRKCDVKAKVECVLTTEEISKKSYEEINEIINKKMEYNHFKSQIMNRIRINEPFRADYLNRVLFKCPNCLEEGTLVGKGINVTCTNCNKKYELSEYGELISDFDTFKSIPEWYKWERECVKKEIQNKQYLLKIEVIIYILKDFKSIYKVGEGLLTHDEKGFHLEGCDGKLDYCQSPLDSYSLYSDYYWYEIGDMICIGNNECRFYCFPKNQSKDVVAKTRLATEELFKLKFKNLKIS